MEGRLYRYRTKPGSLQAFESPVNHDFKVITMLVNLDTRFNIKWRANFIQCLMGWCQRQTLYMPALI